MSDWNLILVAWLCAACGFAAGAWWASLPREENTHD